MKIPELNLNELNLNFHPRGHFRFLFSGLLQAGFSPTTIPKNKSIPRNGVIVVLRIPGRRLRFRIFIYKVTQSSRGRPNERRIQITNTYPKGLERVGDAQDIVLGWDYDNEVFVGLNPERLEHGGPTGNASSFVDGQALVIPQANKILVRPHRSSLFPQGFEFHAFFKRWCIADYLFHISDVHRGQYRGDTFLFGRGRKVLASPPTLNGEVTFASSKRPRQPVLSQTLVRAVERQNFQTPIRRISAREFVEIQRTCEENGRLGEEFVLEREKLALIHAGRSDLACDVRWTSETSVFEGYDILSFFPNGQKKYIEVKSTSGDGKVFQMSSAEWNFGSKHGDNYVIYRVTHVTSKEPQVKEFPNILVLEASGRLVRSASGWNVTLK